MRSDVLAYTLTYGSFYGLLAAGISVTYRATNVFNFAQGGLVMLGGMMTTVFVGMLADSMVLGGLAALVVVVAVSLATEQLAVRPVLRRDPHSHMWVISTLGVSLIIDDLAGKVWDSDPRFVAAPFGLSAQRSDGPLGMSVYELVLVAIEFFYRTRWGRATLAVAENREAAELRGIRPGAVARLAFVVGGLLAGLAGVLIAPVLYASITLGPLMLIKGFMAAAVGGVGNTRGGLIGGLLIAAGEAYTGAYLAPGYQSTITFLVLLVVLLARPTGLFRTTGAARV